MIDEQKKAAQGSEAGADLQSAPKYFEPDYKSAPAKKALKKDVQAQTDDQNDEKDQQIEELKNQLARAVADLQNFKRRSEEEKASFIKFANAELLKSILPILDNLDRSISHLPEELKENEWAKGMTHIHSDLLKTFEKLNITKIKTVGERLDLNKHEALMAGPGEKDIITEEFEPGYNIGDETLKPAKVKVGDGTK